MDTSDTTHIKDESLKDRKPAGKLGQDSGPSLFVGIGASAGGLEALSEFLDALPSNTGCSFIVVQHLSPDFKSLMDELLAKHTSMSVENVVDGVSVCANSIYLMPARKNLMLAEGKLYLADQMQNQGVNLPIDVFFRSLAESANEKSVAIVLSGTGSDGSRGIKSVKESGGLIMVQDPATAKFDGMPISAVHTGLADFSLSPSAIAEKLSSYANHPHISGSDNKPPLNTRFEQESDVLRRIFDLLRQEGHIDFSHYKASTVARRIEQRIGINQLHTLREYLTLLEDSVKEVQTLGRELLINVTRFFRDEEAYKFVEERVAARIVQKAMNGQEVRIWTAGCSTGEEPYSLAIVFDEAIRKSGKDLRLKIFATDVDSEAIAEASAGQYSRGIVNDVSPERLERYFQSVHDGYEVRSDLRQSVVFAYHNMISDPPFSNIDFISCRNVLIYFQHAAQKKVISSFHFSLKPDAPVFFGSSESIGELKSHFKVVNEGFRIYQKISNVKLPLGNVIRNTRTGSAQQRLGIPPISGLLRNYRVSAAQDLGFEHVKDRLINNHVGACVILNSEHQAVHVYGDASKYMNPITSGRVSTRIQDLILPELTVALDTALSRSRSEEKPVLFSHIPVQINDEQTPVNMQTEYFASDKDMTAYYSVTFKEATSPQVNRRDVESFDVGEQAFQRIRDLENDILHKQEHLQATNEELETTNEELQSANEELMSSNEELQSTNEELQSVNEELFTVNSEFQEKISELTLANDDFDNVLSSTAVGIMFLDDQIRIRRITDVARRFFNVLPSDIGRPLDHISHDLKYDAFFDDIRRVVITQEPIYREVFSIAGEFVQVKLMAYKSSDEGASKGCIIAITDLSHRKLSDREKVKKNERKKRASEHRASETIGSGLNVLIIDDSESDRSAIKRYLEKIETFEINILFASSIDEGLVQLDNTDVDVCLLDYRLDPSKENDFIQKAKLRDHSVPIILVSGYTREQIQQQLPMSDMSLFIQKGELSPLVLELSIKHALGSSFGISDNSN